MSTGLVPGNNYVILILGYYSGISIFLTMGDVNLKCISCQKLSLLGVSFLGGPLLVVKIFGMAPITRPSQNYCGHLTNACMINNRNSI